MKIAIFLPDMSCGGAERVLLSVMQALIEKRYDVELVLLRNKGDFLQKIPSGVKTTILDKRRMLFAVPALVSYINKTKPDVILSSLLHANIALLLAKLFTNHKTEYVIRIENNISAFIANSDLSVPLRFLSRFLSLLIPCADRIIAISNGVKDDLTRNFRVPGHKITTIYNPVINIDFQSLLSEKPDHPWLTDKLYPVVVAAGRLEKQKGFDVLISSFALVCGELDCRLIIIGEGSQRQYLEKLIAHNNLQNKVSMPGFVPNPYSFFKNADLFVMTSIYEGFGCVLAEALACGTPVIASDCPSGPSEILKNGKFGTLVEPGNAQETSKAILQSLRDKSINKADDQWLNQFTIDHAITEYIKILKPDLKIKTVNELPTIKTDLKIVDFCGTVFRCNTSTEYLAYIARHNPLKFKIRFYTYWIIASTLRRLNMIHSHEYMGIRVKCLKGISRNHLQETAIDFADHLLKNHTNQTVYDNLVESIKEGTPVIIASYTLNLILDPFKQRLDINTIGSDLEFDNDVCSGRYKTNLLKSGKLATLCQALGSNDLSNACFITDDPTADMDIASAVKYIIKI